MEQNVQLKGFIVIFRNRHNNYLINKDCLIYAYSLASAKLQIERDYGEVLSIRETLEGESLTHRMVF